MNNERDCSEAISVERQHMDADIVCIVRAGVDIRTGST
jgi:hypothetical protein